MLKELEIIRPVKISSKWDLMDYFGALKVRLAIGRNSYKVMPGLYAINNPDNDSEVFVTANYKLSFDILRRELEGLNAWILVLDTKGINVWCAAGKGTFGTDELINQISRNHLETWISHRRIIVPQLGAPGINAHLVKAQSGYLVKFGPIRASDIKDYLKMDMKKSESMSGVQFNFYDRLKIIPVEVVMSFLKFILVTLLFVGLSGFSKNGYSFSLIPEKGLFIAMMLFVAYLGGTVFTPMFLPYLPFRSFAAKGLIMGAILVIPVLLIYPLSLTIFGTVSVILLGITVSSFLAMNFTGASTYTSLSGVRKEMRIFVPFQITAALLGTILFIISLFVNL